MDSDKIDDEIECTQTYEKKIKDSNRTSNWAKGEKALVES